MKKNDNTETCYFCGYMHFEKTEVDQTFYVNGKHCLVRHIPAKVCHTCGETVFSAEVGEQIRKILHAEVAAPCITSTMEQYEYA